MKNSVLLSFLILSELFVCVSAKAEVLTCLFSNPFLAINYNGPMNRVSVMELGTQPDDAGIIPATQLYFMGENKFEIQTLEGRTILSLAFTNAGFAAHDRNAVYPFEATYTYPFDEKNAPPGDQYILRPQKGVCESAKLKKKIVEVYQ